MCGFVAFNAALCSERAEDAPSDRPLPLFKKVHPDGVVLDTTERRRITSRFVRDTYQIWVDLPWSYKARPGKRFPLIVLLDAPILFSAAEGMHKVFANAPDEKVPDCVVVGVAPDFSVDANIGLIPFMQERGRDYTATHMSEEEIAKKYSKSLASMLGGRTGGAPRFTQFLKLELIPLIEREYRVTSDRAIVGYSASAGYGCYVLFKEPGLFRRFVLLSPWLEWDDYLVARKLQKEFFERHSDLTANIYICTGSREIGDPLNPNEEGRNEAAFVERFKARHYPSLKIDRRVFDDESHATVWMVGYSHGIRAVFSDFVEE